MITTATQARTDFFDLIKSTIQKHETHHIHHKNGSVVMMSEEEYESLMETLYLLSSPEFKKRLKVSLKQVKMGDFLPLDKVL